MTSHNNLIIYLSIDGLFLNGDVGFDSLKLRELCEKKGIIPNFCFNKRNGNVRERDDSSFDDILYKKEL